MTGQMFGSFQLLEKLGEGGMGEVYRARDTKLGRDVAIKILPPAFAADPDRLARFEREAQLLASLNHPHIAQIYGLEAHDAREGLHGSKRPFIVMELVEGETLERTLRQQPSGALATGDALAIARQIADALDAAHERGIVHRDLKPANIAITADRTVKVLDFGLAKAGTSDGSGSAGAAGRWDAAVGHFPPPPPPPGGGGAAGAAPDTSPPRGRGEPQAQ